MSALKRRDRTVIFRLTQDEYDAMKALCMYRGARNISDFARSALLMSMGRDIGMAVDQRLAELESRVKYLTELLEAMVGRKTGQGMGETK